MRVELDSPEEGHAGWHSGLAFSAERETAMCQDIIRTVDRATGAQSVRKVATAEHTLNPIIDDAARQARERGGRLIWLQESTTGWARMKAFVGDRAEFLLANVLQMPLPPKAQRRKTDKVDTARMAREYLNGELPLAFQPEGACRQLRRLVSLRENLIGRRTSLRNWITRYLAHECCRSDI